MMLAHLILAHLIGDFILQPTRLVQWKMSSKVGILTHVAIHFFVMTIILTPFLINGYEWLILMIFAICFFHYWIDAAKINYDLKHDTKVKPFIIDQLLHLLTIMIAYFFLANINWTLPNETFYRIYSNVNIINFISLLVFITAVVDIYLFQKTREQNKKAKLNHPINSLLNRIMTFSILYALLMVLSYYASQTM